MVTSNPVEVRLKDGFCQVVLFFIGCSLDLGRRPELQSGVEIETYDTECQSQIVGRWDA